MAAARRKALPPEVVGEDEAPRARYARRDGFRPAAAARTQGGAFARGRGGVPESRVVGTDIVTSAENAALANGMLGHADETDDSHAPSLSHPGCAIVPAALAMAEKDRRDGRSFLRAVALGYDIGARLNLSLHPYAFREAGHSTHAFGPLFGSAAAAGTSPAWTRARCAISFRTPGSNARACLLDARRGAHRESLRFRRHAGAQRCRRGDDGRARLLGRGGRVLRRAQLLRRLRRARTHRQAARPQRLAQRWARPTRS